MRGSHGFQPLPQSVGVPFLGIPHLQVAVPREILRPFGNLHQVELVDNLVLLLCETGVVADEEYVGQRALSVFERLTLAQGVHGSDPGRHVPPRLP